MTGIAAVTSALSQLSTQATAQVPRSGAASTADGSFGDMVQQAMQSISVGQQTTDALAAQAATGDLRDVHDYMIAATEASLATELTLAVRNKVVESFNQIMQMPI